jgi:hypothetical protein
VADAMSETAEDRLVGKSARKPYQYHSIRAKWYVNQ